MSTLPNTPVAAPSVPELTLSDFAAALQARWRVVVAVPLLAAGAALGISYLITPTFTARTSFMPPQQQQGGAAGTLASLGALAGLSGSVRNTGDQFVTFVVSRTVADGILKRFDLTTVYDEKLAHDARLKLADRTRVSLG